MQTFKLDYPPSVNNLYATVQGRRVISAFGRRYKTGTAYLAKQQGAKILTGDVSFTIRIFRPKRLGDLDNRIKIVQDALKGVCFVDDKQITEIHAYRFEDAANPRIEVEIKEV